MSLVPGNNLLNNVNNKVNGQAPMNNISAIPNINAITHTVKSIGYSNNIVTQPINLSGKGVNDANNSISFIPKLGVSVSPPINQVVLIQPNIINNNMIESNNLREPYETINLAEFKLVREIGKGTFGRIYDGVKVRQHRNEAIKAFIKNTKSNGVVCLYGNLTIPIGNEFQYYELMEMCERDFEQEIKPSSGINRIYTEMELSNVILQLVYFYEKNNETKIFHLIYANEGSAPGKYYNQFTLDFLENNYQNVTHLKPFDVIKTIKERYIIFSKDIIEKTDNSEEK